MLELVAHSPYGVQESCGTHCFPKAVSNLTVGHLLQAMWAWWDFNSIKSLPTHTSFIVLNPTIKFIPLGYIYINDNNFLDIIKLPRLVNRLLLISNHLFIYLSNVYFY